MKSELPEAAQWGGPPGPRPAPWPAFPPRSHNLAPTQESRPGGRLPTRGSALLCTLALTAATLFGQPQQLEFLNHNRPVLDAHNCYPYDGKWADRIERALSTGLPISIEQDLAWYIDPGGSKGRVVIAHSVKALSGSEPSLKEHFFERIRPIVEKALKDRNRDRWPLIILHLDFKTNDTPLLRAAWDLLGDYEAWITTARKGSDPNELVAFDAKPILVLTEDSDAQEEVFFHQVPVGAKLRLFGSAHTTKIPGSTDAERAHFAATLAPEKLLTERPTNYRRWWNNSWYVVEEGGQANAADWTAADRARLRSLVQHAHSRGFWIRFYVLNGYRPAENRGWDNNYNFGSQDAALVRWKASIDAGVDLIATDQYEALRAVITSATAAGSTPK
jgi:hypothetical protein